ncbi:nocturnin-like isoform X1 [Adelges cooleyi]|uniref:nocturnin-like isoform X1 n=2 Tax=Adelges cooleyi TaxID=133065 RepID=UPI00217FA48B|nr:nocturnin-like isoform X1 [Adelges cooleyi]
MILQEIVFIIIANIIIAQGTLRPDRQDKTLVFTPEMNSKELLLNYCYDNSEQVNIIGIKRQTINWDHSRKSTKKNVRVLQWNILSQALGQNMDNFYRCPLEALEWNNRRCALLEEMLTHEPDVMCLQEVDHFDFFNRALATQSYTGIFQPKPRSPAIAMPDNNGPDGCAIFYNNNKYEFHEKFEHNFYHLSTSNCRSAQVALLVVLIDKVSGNKFCVATAHLKSRKGGKEACLRNNQGKDLLSFVSEHAKNCPTIITGDFNAAPYEPVYETMCSYPEFKLNSAYKEPGEEPKFTSWKIRQREGDCKETLDYIFYTPEYLTIRSILAMPKEENVHKDRTPSLLYPSDHFSLIADFFFNET